MLNQKKAVVFSDRRCGGSRFLSGRSLAASRLSRTERPLVAHTQQLLFHLIYTRDAIRSSGRQTIR